MGTLDEWMKKPEDFSNSTVAEILFGESLRLYESKRLKEALVLINVSIENNESYEYYNTKALILKDLDRFSESKKAFLSSLGLKKDVLVLANYTEMLYKWANSLNDKKKALGIITEAIRNLPFTNLEPDKFWYLKGSILDCLESPVEARKCYLIAEGETDEVRKLDNQLNIIANSSDTLVNITGTQFYFGLDIFKAGTVVDLIKEKENVHDSDAVRVEIDGETVGYVANSDYTLIDGIKSATDIKDVIKDNQKAEVMFVYFESYVIARLL